MSMRPAVPPYFDGLIAGFRRGAVGRHVHLGHWDRPASDAPGEFERAQARLDDIVAGMADARSGDAVLDVACGFGGTLEGLNRRLERAELTGINIDARQLELCRGIAPRRGNTLRWQEADACRLPFADAAFDRVLCIEAMFHFASRRAFFGEAARVLRAGGRMVASDIVIDPRARALAEAPALEAAIRAAYGPWPDFWSADADHAALASGAGLRLAEQADATAATLPSHRFTAPSHGPASDPAGRAALALKWLHENGHLRYLYLRFDKD
jgi:SAM-dependent methyltransferase